MAAPIWDLPIRERYDAIVEQIGEAYKQSETVKVTYRMSEIDDALLFDFFKIEGISEPVDNIGRQQLVVSDPTDSESVLRTISLENVGAIDPHITGCEGHESTIGSVDPYVEYCDGRCKS